MYLAAALLPRMRILLVPRGGNALLLCGFRGAFPMPKGIPASHSVCIRSKRAVNVVPAILPS